MSQRAIFDATLYVNNNVVAYVANTLKTTSGKGERTVDAQVSGAGATENVTSEDVSTKKSKVMFDLKSTVENKTLARTWQNNFDANVIRVVHGSGASYIYQNATVINDPEFDLGVDGNASLEFEGLPEVEG